MTVPSSGIPALVFQTVCAGSRWTLSTWSCAIVYTGGPTSAARTGSHSRAASTSHSREHHGLNELGDDLCYVVPRSNTSSHRIHIHAYQNEQRECYAGKPP